MSDGALLSLALAAVTLGMASLAMGMTAHWREVSGHRLQSASLRWSLRVIGAGMLALSFLACLAADPLMMAILVWPMLLFVGAGLVAAGLSLHAAARRGRRTRKDGGSDPAVF